MFLHVCAGACVCRSTRTVCTRTQRPEVDARESSLIALTLFIEAGSPEPRDCHFHLDKAVSFPQGPYLCLLSIGIQACGFQILVLKLKAQCFIH